MSIHVLMLRALTLVSSFSRSNLPSISPSGVHSPLLSTPPVPPFPCLDPPSLSIPVPPPPRPPVPPSPRAPSSPPQGHESTFFSLFAPADKSASFAGPLLVGLITELTGEFLYAFALIVGMMLLPLPLLLFVDVSEGQEQAGRWVEVHEGGSGEREPLFGADDAG